MKKVSPSCIILFNINPKHLFKINNLKKIDVFVEKEKRKNKHKSHNDKSFYNKTYYQKSNN